MSALSDIHFNRFMPFLINFSRIVCLIVIYDLFRFIEACAVILYNIGVISMWRSSKNDIFGTASSTDWLEIISYGKEQC